jgi:ADP-heptose:LPS heptosyltransferase
VNSFLIVRLGSLGDVIHGIPVAAALKSEFPSGRVDWMVDPRYVELLDLVTCVDRRIAVDPRAVKRGEGRERFRETMRELREMDYDAVIDLQGLLKSAMLRAVRGQNDRISPEAFTRTAGTALLHGRAGPWRRDSRDLQESRVACAAEG